MSTKLDRDNRQFRMGNNRYRTVTIKGADPTTFEPGQLMEYDPADDTWIIYTGGVITDRTRAVLNLDEAFTMAGVTEITASILISGDVFADKLDLPGAFVIDDRPNAAVLSIREQLRDVGILAFDSVEVTEDHITA